MWQMWNDTDKNSMHNEIERSLNSRIPSIILFRILYLPVCCLIYGTIIEPLVLCGCESWPLTLREEHVKSVQECSRIEYWGRYLGLRGRLWKLYSGELHSLYFLQNITFVISRKEDEMGRARGMYWGRRNVCKVLVGPLWRPRHIWEDSITLDLY
jgi:hypothetical protein